MHTFVRTFFTPHPAPPRVETPCFTVTRPAAGFPSPAMGYEQDAIDLNEALIQHKESTFLTKADGHSMSPRINDGDLLLVDKRAEIRSGDIIIAPVGEGYVVKIFQKYSDGSVKLLSANQDCEPINIPDDDPFMPLGKVTAIIQKLI